MKILLLGAEGNHYKTNIPYDGWTLYTYVAKEMFLLKATACFKLFLSIR